VCSWGFPSRIWILDLLTIGTVNDMFVESRNDEYKGWRKVATQEDFDRF
jgi:hypothetical protein